MKSATTTLTVKVSRKPGSVDMTLPWKSLYYDNIKSEMAAYGTPFEGEEVYDGKTRKVIKYGKVGSFKSITFYFNNYSYANNLPGVVVDTGLDNTMAFASLLATHKHVRSYANYFTCPVGRYTQSMEAEANSKSSMIPYFG